MSSIRFNAHLDTSHRGPKRRRKVAGVVADNLDRHPQCYDEVPLRCQQEMHTQ
jgi:hypothetical protein